MNRNISDIKSSVINENCQPEIIVLELLSEMSFPAGKKLLSLVLMGQNSDRIKRLKLDKTGSFGALCLYSKEDIAFLFEKMKINSLIETQKTQRTGFLPVIAITQKGKMILNNPEMLKNMEDKKSKEAGASSFYSFEFSSVTKKDREIFNAFGDILSFYDDEQKKAIIEPAQKIACIAGAGSGKTTVLTKRIEFLVKYRGIAQDKILAITFTRKARQQMIQKLSSLIPGHKIKVETFNSFCEGILRKYQDREYNKSHRVLDYKSRIKLVQKAIQKSGHSLESALKSYFSARKARETEQRLLFFRLINDIFSILDNQKNSRLPLSNIRQRAIMIADNSQKNNALFIYTIAKKVEELKEEMGFRDYTDQMTHVLELFSKEQSAIPEFEHVLVDEYQDVNDLQVGLLDALAPENIFVVGDPRQSIYGWRGSKISHIAGFCEKHNGASALQLATNYRSLPDIVCCGNLVIKGMGLADISPAKKEINSDAPCLISHPDQISEAVFIAQSIASQKLPRKDIFVLARTNSQLDFIAETLAGYNIRFIKRTIEENNPLLEPADDEVTLSTVHAIKGLEAELVYLAGVNSNMYPCLVSDNPALDALKDNGCYDKYEEEMRLLYVAITRAKKRLVISHFNTLSPFITQDMQKIMNNAKEKSQGRQRPEISRIKTAEPANDNYKKPYGAGHFLGSAAEKLRAWRLKKAQELKIKPFMVLHDKVLFAIAELMPTTKDQLMDIPGIGPSKLFEFGDEIIDVLYG